MAPQVSDGKDKEMVATEFPVRYQDPVYQKTHRTLFSNSLTHPLEPVLPPAVTQEQFNCALEELRKVLGHDGVFTGKSLEDYIDPYELWEGEGRRKTPSAAVWSASALEFLLNKVSLTALTVPVRVRKSKEF